MTSLVARLFLFAALFSALPASAQVAATIEGVQMPAWVERDGRRMPLTAGMELRAGDQLHTGAGSRLVVKLAEGSLVKLGENGTLRFTELQPGRELLKAALEVLQGAFRFTTSVVAKNRQRDVSIRVSTITAGIRGTDLWGRSRPDTQIICLIEGQVEIAPEGEPALTMDKPLQFYRREKGQSQPVGFVDQKQINQWASETEIEPGKGAARSGGRYSVVLGASDNQKDALGLYDQLRNEGYPAEIVPAKEGDKTVYSVRIRRLPSQAEAQALAAQLRGKFGIAEPKATR